MFSMLARIGAPQAVGIHIEGSVAHACRVAATPLGTVQLAQHSGPIDLADPKAGIARVLGHVLKRGSERLPVAIGLPIEQTFFTTRSMQARGGEASPRVLLREALQSTAVPVDEMVVDVVRSQPGRRQLASIVSCRRTLVEQLVEPLEDFQLPELHVEPEACALLRRARKQDRAGNNAKAVCRVFLSPTHILAVLTAKRQPVLWRKAQLPRGDEASTIVTLVRSLITISDQSGLETRPELVIMHGRSDLPRLFDMTWFESQFEMPLKWLDGPGLEPAETAAGLAEGCLDEGQSGLDLAKEYQPRRTLWQAFPAREAAVHAFLIAALAVFLCIRLTMVRDEYAAASARNVQGAIASQSIGDLEKEKKDLQQRVSAVERFLDSRVLWTNYERDLAASLPESIFLTSVRGINELPSSGKEKAKPKKQLVLKGAVTLPQNGLIPHEVDGLMNTLREHPTLKRDFAVIELAELKQYKQVDSDQTLAMFTVICLPKGGKK